MVPKIYGDATFQKALIGRIKHYTKKFRKFQVSELRRVFQMQLIYWLNKDDMTFDLN